MKDAIILGAGGLGREVAAWLRKYHSNDFHLVGFVDDTQSIGKEVHGIPILGTSDWLMTQERPLSVFLGIGNPRSRKMLFDKLQLPPLQWPNLVHPSAQIHDEMRIVLGKGNLIAAGCILTADIQMGNANYLNLQCSVGHDVTIGSGCALMPGVHISGGAKIGNGVYIGTGAVLIKATLVGDGATIGAAAMVNADIPPGETWVGVPAKPLNP